jgi:hypothetical protein
MTPKEKAEELYNKMYGETPIRAIISEIEKDKQCAKQCALIAVYEIIKVCPYISKNNCTSLEQVRADDIEFSEYWQEVKQEIEKL